MKAKHVLNWIPDLPDKRDHMYAVDAPVALPAYVDLAPQCSPVEDQGQIGSCTGNALVGNMEFLELKQGMPFTDFSRLFVYYNERVIEHSTKSDAGASLRDGIKTLVKQGVCAETSWKYRKSNVTRKPTPACYTEAKKHVAAEYQRILSVNQMKTCLASGYPFVFGFSVYESFESTEVARTGVVPMPQPHERMIGGHAVMCVGYDDSKSMFYVRNSWGQSWGDSGYFWMPYAYLSDNSLADDFWSVRKET